MNLTPNRFGDGVKVFVLLTAVDATAPRTYVYWITHPWADHSWGAEVYNDPWGVEINNLNM